MSSVNDIFILILVPFANDDMMLGLRMYLSQI